MKTVNFSVVENQNTVDNSKVNATFVQQVKEAFLMFPKSVTMRYKQVNEQLVMSLIFTYENGMKQHLEGACDTELIPAIHKAMGKHTNQWKEYQEKEHEIETAQEGENLVEELFKQYMASHTQRFIEKDWFNKYGERYRCVTFSPAFNKNVKFCLKATDEINSIITEACKPEWMKRAEAEKKQQEEKGQNTVTETTEA